MQEPRAEALQGFLATLPGWDRARVADVTEAGAGWESAIHSFRVEDGPETAPGELVLRRYHGEPGAAKARHEYSAMSGLFASGYPVPEPIAFSESGESLGAPFLMMERIAGPTLWDTMAKAAPDRQPALIAGFTGLLVELHGLDPDPFGAVPSDPQAPGRAAAARLRRLGAAVPGVLPIVAWFEAQIPGVPCDRPVPVHRDFHPGNVLVAPDRWVVIDWTAFGITDPRFDLAWTLLLADAHVGSSMRTAILNSYADRAGSPAEHIEVFEVEAALRRLAEVLASLAAGPDTLGMRPEAVAEMQAAIGPLGRVYAGLRERTGLQVPEAEAFLEAAG